MLELGRQALLDILFEAPQQEWPQHIVQPVHQRLSDMAHTHCQCALTTSSVQHDVKTTCQNFQPQLNAWQPFKLTATQHERNRGHALLTACSPSTMPLRGLENQSLKSAWLANSAGIRKCIRLHSSIRSFCSGVPVGRGQMQGC